MRYYYRFINAVKIGIWAFRNPTTLHESNFKMLSDLLELVFKVAQESRPRMTRVCHVLPDTKEHMDIVTIWAGSGMAADPYDRIMELQKEIAILKAERVKELA